MLEYKKGLKKWLFYILYFLPILILKLDSFLYHISALSVLQLNSEKKDKKTDDKTDNVKNVLKSDIIWLIGGLLINYSSTYIAYFDLFNDNGVKIGGFNLLNKYSMLIPMIFALVWRKIYLKEKRKQYFIRSTLVFLFPMVLNMVISSFLNPRFLGESINHINLFWSALFQAAFFEEIFYRGFLYRLLKNILSKKTVAMIITTVVFTSSHFNLLHSFLLGYSTATFINIVMVIMLSLVTCMQYDYTKSIVTPILYHAINNGAVYYILSMLIM